MTMTRSGKNALRLLAGGLMGALLGPGLAHLVMYFDLPVGGAVLTPGGVVLAATGLVYLLCGLFVWVGVLWPKLGALILNVADEEDLRERSAMLNGGAATCVMLGLAMTLLPFAGPDGPVAADTALGVLAFALVMTGVVAWVGITRRHYDEMWNQVTLEASAIALAILAPLLILWGALVHLGWIAALDPLLVIAALPALLILGSIIALGRKGMLDAG